MNAGAAVGAAATCCCSCTPIRACRGTPTGWCSTAWRGRAAVGAVSTCASTAAALLALIALMMNLRSRLSGIATGDQAMFVTRAAFAAAGGFPPIALMEDVALSARLKRISRPLCLAARVTTSARRWQRHGVLRTILLMWKLRLAFYFGADPVRLAQAYGYAERVIPSPSPSWRRPRSPASPRRG